MNAAARLVFDHITPLLCQLHWLKAKERIDFKLVVLVYKCLHGTAPSYLADELCQPADLEVRPTMSALCFVTITHRPPHSSVHHWRSSIPGRRLLCLEQSATARYVCILIACLPQPPQDSPSFGAVSHNIFLSCIVPAQ